MSYNPGAPSMLMEDDGSSSSGEDVNIPNGSKKLRSTASLSSTRSKRTRKAPTDAIVEAMLEIAAASKLRASAMRSDDRFSISNCVKVLDEIQGLDQRIYYAALDLFENPNARETFISLKSEKRVTWLQGKCRGSPNLTGQVCICYRKLSEMDDSDLELDEMELVAAAAGYYYYSQICKQPRHTASRSRSDFLNEVLNDDESRCREIFRMNKHVFIKLCDIFRQRDLLRDTSGVKIEEQVAIFLNVVGNNERTRVLQERYQHSGETISRHFNNTLKAIKSLSREFMQPPEATTPPDILESTRFYPYFQDCIGVIDGMHVPAHIPAKDQARFRDWKGLLSQNVLAACTFDLQFIFVYPGWEGAAADSHVLRAVLDEPDQNFPQIPEGKYYLVDKDYPNMEGFLSPFQGVRYHLHEYKGANQQPRNAQELFNHRHASLRIAIQKCFNILKARFPILKLAPPYAFPTQRDLVIAACVIHNHIRREDRNDWLFTASENGTLEESHELDDQPEGQCSSMMQDQAAFLLRNSMAGAMWKDFMNEWDTW